MSEELSCQPQECAVNASPEKAWPDSFLLRKAMSALKVLVACTGGFQVTSGYPRSCVRCQSITNVLVGQGQGANLPSAWRTALLTLTALPALSATWAHRHILSHRLQRSVSGYCDLHHATLQKTWISTAKPLERTKVKTQPQAVQNFGVPRNIRRPQDMVLNFVFVQQLKPDFFPSFVLWSSPVLNSNSFQGTGETASSIPDTSLSGQYHPIKRGDRDELHPPLHSHTCNCH